MFERERRMEHMERKRELWVVSKKVTVRLRYVSFLGGEKRREKPRREIARETTSNMICIGLAKQSVWRVMERGKEGS